MKKELVMAVCAAMITAASVQALEVKKPDLSSLKSNVAGAAKTTTAASATKTTTDKSADALKQQQEMQAKIDAANKKLAVAENMANSAIWSLAKISLDDETYKSFNTKKSEINSNKDLTADSKSEQLDSLEKDLIKTLNSQLKAQIKAGDYNPDVYNKTNTTYVNAVKSLQIALNRYENIANGMSPTFKKILDGQISMLNVKLQLVESGKLTKNIKANSMGQRPLLNKYNKINEVNKITVEIPSTEKVVYDKDGIVGGITYQLETTNNNVKAANTKLIDALNLKSKVKAEIDSINSNPDLTQADKDRLIQQAAATVVGDYSAERAAKQKAGEKVAELTSQQKAAIAEATPVLTQAVSDYTSLGLSCAKLGMQISAKPILAAPLALEVGQLKYTGKMLKDSATTLKGTLSAIKALK